MLLSHAGCLESEYMYRQFLLEKWNSIPHRDLDHIEAFLKNRFGNYGNIIVAATVIAT